MNSIANLREPAASLSMLGRTLLAEGSFQEALLPLRSALTQGETDPATLLNLAIAEDRAGDRARAQELMRLVRVQQPHWDEPVLRLAESLRAEGHQAEAEIAYRDTLALNPNRREALVAMAGLLLLREQPEAARDLLIRACGIAPDDGEAWQALSFAHRLLGAAQLGYDSALQAQHLSPGDVTVALGCVDAAIGAGRTEDELRRLEAACERDPLNAAYHVAYGMMLDGMGRRADAIDSLEVACALAPDDLRVLRPLGALLARSGQVSRAERVLRQIAEQDPEDHAAQDALAVTLMRLHRHRDAQALVRTALEQHGPKVSLLCNLAAATLCVGEQDDAVAVARQAVELDPASTMPRRTLCNMLVYQHGIVGEVMLAAARACAVTLPRTPQPPFANRLDPDRKLTIGLLSGSLRIHPVGWLTVAGIEHLDPSQFQTICLAQNAAPNDALARRFRAAALEWIDVDALSDPALVELARSRQIDILIDLGGYGDVSRMPACAHRLAPVQIKWVGMQAHSSGLAEMDWFLTDRWETPEGFDSFYSERLLRLRDGYICYSPPAYAPDVTTLPAARNGFVTFGCFNNLAKITPFLMETWATILHRVPAARLVMKTHQLTDQVIAARVRADFASHGIGADRLELRGASPHRAFLGEYGDIDIVLDPFPYSGGLTTCEALWMGVPTLTYPSETFASRHSASHMSNAGLPDWIASSVPAYIDMAVARAADLPALAELRASLRERTRLSPLCDAPRFGASLGGALRAAWRAWCEVS